AWLPSGDFVPWDGAVLREDTVRQWWRDLAADPPLQRRQRVLARMKRWYETELRRQGGGPGDQRKRQAASRLRSYQARWPELSAVAVYRELLAEALPDAPPLEQQWLRAGSKRRVRWLVNVEDLAPLVYLQARLAGVAAEEKFDHVVIDEAQDWSPCQLAVVLQYCPSQSMTVLGDLAQSIHTYQGVEHWQPLLSLFPEDKRGYVQLDVSYRSTVEIIEFANALLRPFGEFVAARPVFRSGEPVKVQAVAAEERFAQAALAIRQMAVQARTVALLTRTEEDCDGYVAALQAAGLSAKRLGPDDASYAGGVSVLPVYLAKGLEFDAVLLTDVDAQNYRQQLLAAKLLYVGCTRALHRLWIQYAGEPSPLLPQGL
ncbi:MAG: ATP-binding domain-containing protein, partial [Alicyclobacillus sp.]|nr:ATP-binding domain-containing protein [Alicyclobacillus sp.]